MDATVTVEALLAWLFAHGFTLALFLPLIVGTALFWYSNRRARIVKAILAESAVLSAHAKRLAVSRGSLADHRRVAAELKAEAKKTFVELRTMREKIDALKPERATLETVLHRQSRLAEQLTHELNQKTAAVEATKKRTDQLQGEIERWKARVEELAIAFERARIDEQTLKAELTSGLAEICGQCGEGLSVAQNVLMEASLNDPQRKEGDYQRAIGVLSAKLEILNNQLRLCQDGKLGPRAAGMMRPEMRQEMRPARRLKTATSAR